MSCSPIELRDYFFQELDAAARSRVEAHVRTCPGCREELERLRGTEAALLVLRDEEIPQRIAFVSDKVFEPSRLRRWWQAFWGSSARLGFAAAALLSGAILYSALTRPAPVASAPAPQVDLARLEASFQARLDKALAASEQRQARQTADLLSAAERRFEIERASLQVATEKNLEYLQKKLNVAYLASAQQGNPQ